MPLCCESYKIFVASRHWPKWATKISTVLHTLVLRAGIIVGGELARSQVAGREIKREKRAVVSGRAGSQPADARAKLLLRLQVICRMRCPDCPLAAAAAAAINAGPAGFHFPRCRRIYKRCSNVIWHV